ncbi:MAG: MFS transporter [Betaproteobacteria bacterium]|jgi:MFS family permease|nr:MFS transporter [Betaproteobacteria bacterium]NBT67087.1 MFS transporter [Betaproteobacteria bacterium]NBY08983.1 MFS transporter [Betaproteobacteria bacterium]
MTSSALLSRKNAVIVFIAFASAYFLSALVRAITATLSPTLTTEFQLQSSDLGLLAGGYFFGFALTQLPLGNWLDRHGPKKVLLGFLSLSVLGCILFSIATDFSALLLARVITGIGVSACLMAPLTGYRRWFDAGTQIRANSWMLMSGSVGMLASTLPVQWLMPIWGWRPIFIGLGLLIVLSMLLITWTAPAWKQTQTATKPGGLFSGYGEVWRHPYFKRLMPMGFFCYAGLVAMQTLWAGPWMVRVSGYSADEGAWGLFVINVVMMFTFWAWGFINPWLATKGWDANKIMTWGVPLSLMVSVWIAQNGQNAGLISWVLFCVTSSFVSISQPALGMAFPATLVGRALSAYNLVIFSGIFVVQWGFGLLVDLLKQIGWSNEQAYQGAMGTFAFFCISSYLYFLHNKVDNPSIPTAET